MNILEHHIIDIYFENDVEGTDKVEVSYRVDCWGHKQTKHEILSKEYWEKIKEQGYYLG